VHTPLDHENPAHAAQLDALLMAAGLVHCATA